VGPLVLPKKDKIDPWRLAVSGTFALIIKNYTGSENVCVLGISKSGKDE
jgi:hypothetical protein